MFSAVVPGIDSFSYFYTLFMTPLFLFSGIFFPLESLPRAVSGIAFFTPLYHLVKVCRALSAGNVRRRSRKRRLDRCCRAAPRPFPFRLMRKRVIA